MGGNRRQKLKRRVCVGGGIGVAICGGEGGLCDEKKGGGTTSRENT